MGDDNTCPLCGRRYHHKYTIYKNDGTPEFAADVAVCSRTSIGKEERVYYIHWIADS